MSLSDSFVTSFFEPCCSPSVPQEELRELRQQPIDPQAEQEIIDSIGEVYFSNDSFDMVQHELEVRYSLWIPDFMFSAWRCTFQFKILFLNFSVPPQKNIMISSNFPRFGTFDNISIKFVIWINMAYCALSLIWLAGVKLFLTCLFLFCCAACISLRSRLMDCICSTEERCEISLDLSWYCYTIWNETPSQEESNYLSSFGPCVFFVIPSFACKVCFLCSVYWLD